MLLNSMRIKELLGKLTFSYESLINSEERRRVNRYCLCGVSGVHKNTERPVHSSLFNGKMRLFSCQAVKQRSSAAALSVVFICTRWSRLSNNSTFCFVLIFCISVRSCNADKVRTTLCTHLCRRTFRVNNAWIYHWRHTLTDKQIDTSGHKINT